MKCKVLANFRDKNTGELHKEGTFYECNKTRYEEVQMVGNFLKEVKEPKKEEKKPKKEVKK